MRLDGTATVNAKLFRLTAAGAKLAAAVLRRHRLVELFLVQVMGMRWADVHDSLRLFCTHS